MMERNSVMGIHYAGPESERTAMDQEWELIEPCERCWRQVIFSSKVSDI